MRAALLFVMLTIACAAWSQSGESDAPPAQMTVEERIEQSLDQPSKIVDSKATLGEFAEQISSQHKIPVFIDRKAMEEIGLNEDAPVNIPLNASLRSVLQLTLRDLDMTSQNRDEVLMLTTREAAEANLTVRIYVLPSELASSADRVIKLIQSTINPGTWETLGGASTAYSLDHLIVVSTHSDIHHQIDTFLEKLSRIYIETKPDSGSVEEKHSRPH